MARPSPKQRGRGGKALLAAVALILPVVLVIRNSHPVHADFIFTSATRGRSG